MFMVVRADAAASKKRVDAIVAAVSAVPERPRRPDVYDFYSAERLVAALDAYFANTRLNRGMITYRFNPEPIDV